MTRKSNHRTAEKEGGGPPSTLALVKQEHPKKPEESEHEYRDRVDETAYWRLSGMKKRTKDQEEEFAKLKERFDAMNIVKGGALPYQFVDADLQLAVRRYFDEISKSVGEMTPIKCILIDRLVSAIAEITCYDRMFLIARYKLDEKHIPSWNESPARMNFLKEIRRGRESADNRILRFAQSLENLSGNSIHVKVKNAVIAQNMQINQTSPPKDLENISEPLNNE